MSSQTLNLTPRHATPRRGSVTNRFSHSMAFIHRSIPVLLCNRTFTGCGKLLTLTQKRNVNYCVGKAQTSTLKCRIVGQTLLVKRDFHAVTKDVVLFKDERSTFYRLLSFGATLMGVAAIYNGLTFFKGSARMALRFDRAKSSMDVDESTWWRRYKAKLFRLVSGDTIRYGVTIIMCFFGVMCVFGAVIIPVRVVHKMSLLKGGHQVSITTFGPYGFPRSYNIRVDDITATVQRKSYYSAIPINAKGFYPGFRIDNQNGTFLNTELFDDVVSIQKIFKK